MLFAALGPLPPWVGFSGVALVAILIWLLLRAGARSARAEGDLDRIGQILNVARESVVVTNARGQITEWNPAAELTFGPRREDVLGKRRWLPHSLRRDLCGCTPPHRKLVRQGRYDCSTTDDCLKKTACNATSGADSVPTPTATPDAVVAELPPTSLPHTHRRELGT